MGCMEALGRTPFASLIAAIICFVGVGIFCGTLYRALEIVIVSIMQELFLFNVSWLEVLQTVFIVIGVGMAGFAILLLVFGFLATGATRKNVYSGQKCVMGGRVSAAFFIFISYILNLVWIVILGVSIVPIFLYLSMTAICQAEVWSKNQNTIKYCFSLTQFGVYRNVSYVPGVPVPGKDTLCSSEELSRLCLRVAEAGPLFCVACGGALLIVLSMVHFMITLSANYTRIKISKELTEYRDAVDMEELELNSITGRKSPFNSTNSQI